MRRNDLSDGSIKMLLILALAVANLVAALPNQDGRSQFPGSGRRGGPAFGASPNARLTSDTRAPEKFSARAPKTAREARALPGYLPPD